MTQFQPEIPHRWRIPLPKQLYISLALLAVLAAVIMACGFGSPAGSDANSGNTGAPTATTAPAPDATSVPATPTHAPPTATPLPVLKSQIITKSLGSINPGANSPIVDITCPTGYLVASGGPKSGYSNFTMMWNAPISATTWRAEANNDGTGVINVDVQVVCLAFPGLHSQIITKAFNNIGPHTNSSIADMVCPSGYLVAGGGPNSGYSNFTVMWGAAINTTTWQAEVYNDSSSTINVQMQVVCMAVAGLQSQIVTKSLGSINPGANSAITAIACPSGYLVAGGGPNSGYYNFTLMWDAPISTTTWQSEANNDNTSGSAIFVQMQIVCMKH